MLGRGIDQILAHSVAPRIYESIVSSAGEYVELAEQAHGTIPRRVAPEYVWGDALAVLRDERLDARIINLETAVTTSEDAEAKGINYRMHPRNVDVLTAAAIDCASLANNHVLDWGVDGLVETLHVLRAAEVQSAGAGLDAATAAAPAIIDRGSGARVLVYAFGARDSGIPRDWRADAESPGVNLLPDFSDESVARVVSIVRDTKRDGDIVIASIHWGGNWGYEVPAAHRRFAHALIDESSIDVVYGHSSHHPRAIEMHHGKPILYGCGDFINDYEGIPGYESYRGDLSLMYFVSIDETTNRYSLEMVPMQIYRFRLRAQTDSDRAWLRDTLSSECERFGSRVVERDGRFALQAM